MTATWGSLLQVGWRSVLSGVSSASQLWNRGKFRDAVRAADRDRDAGNWSAARDGYTRALAINPNAAGIWVQFGHAAKGTGDMAAAEAAYRRADAMRPDNADIQVQLGHLLKDTGRPAEAALRYRSAVRHGSTDPIALELASKDDGAAVASPHGQTLRRQADIARDTGQFAIAVALYKEIAETAPDADVFLQLGHCAKEAGRYGTAEQAYQSALELRPTDASCLLRLGQLMRLAGRPDQAARFYARSLTLNPHQPGARQELQAMVELKGVPAVLRPPHPADTLPFGAADIVHERLRLALTRRRA